MLKICFAFQCIVIGLYATELKKVYVYHAPEQAPCIQAELAKVVFHFDQKPVLSYASNAAPHKLIATYFFPARVADSVFAQLKHINKNDAYYKMSCSRMQSPNEGLRVQIQYDPRCVACISQSYDAITGDKGVMLQIVHKSRVRRAYRDQKKVAKGRNRRKIVLDFGHGGKDSGAIGLHGAIEKEITLRIGTYLAELLRAHGYEVFLTRHDDSYLSLPERAAAVEKFGPDFLVSIHANSAQANAAGIETYCLTPALFSSTGPQESLPAFNQLIHQRYATSLRLAQAVHRSCIEQLKGFTADRGVRHAVSQVLLAINVPGILIEVGFVSNDTEARLLIDKDYQLKLAQAIFKAVSSL